MQEPPRTPPPANTLRYAEYLGAIHRHHRQISYNELVALERSMPQQPGRLRAVDLHRLVTPYVSVRFAEQIRAVVPLALMLTGFQALALRSTLLETGPIVLGILAVITGLMFFMEGVKHGLMPFAENIGFLLPTHLPVAAMLGFAALLGAAATIAEPAIGALQFAGAGISSERAYLLKALLEPYVSWLVAAVAGGVGAAVALGFVRTLLGWRLKSLILLIVPPCLILTLWCAQHPGLRQIIGLAWDCGAITTGPVTVPLVLAVGIGVAAAAGRSDNPLSGFGIVTLASLLPVLAVLGTALYLDTQDPATLLSSSNNAALPTEADWMQQTPMREITGALRAILPLVLLLYLVQRFVLGQKIRSANVIVYGICLALLGMMLFNLGLTSGLVALGEQAGTNVPWAFSPHRTSGAPPLYPYALGITMTLLFAFVVGYGATVAEPALGAMGITVENLTDGAFTKRLLIHAVAAGVGLGATLGIARILFDWPLGLLLPGGYGLALLMTILAEEEFVNLAWDSAGVTTGPVTVPLLLSLGMGLGQATGNAEGFGVLALASLGPILSVLAVGLWIERQRRQEEPSYGNIA